MKQKRKTKFNFLIFSVKEKCLQVGKCKIKANMKELKSKRDEEI